MCACIPRAPSAVKRPCKQRDWAVGGVGSENTIMGKTHQWWTSPAEKLTQESLTSCESASPGMLGVPCLVSSVVPWPCLSLDLRGVGTHARIAWSPFWAYFSYSPPRSLLLLGSAMAMLILHCGEWTRRGCTTCGLPSCAGCMEGEAMHLICRDREGALAGGSNSISSDSQ